MSTPTFESHGKVWIRHKPGDPMPVIAHKAIYTIWSDDATEGPLPPFDFRWEVEGGFPSLIGYRLATAPKDEGVSAEDEIVQLREQLREARAEIERLRAALKDMVGKFAYALGLLGISKGDKDKWGANTSLEMAVLALQPAKPAQDCNACCGTGSVEIQSGPYERTCEACGGTGKKPAQDALDPSSASVDVETRETRPVGSIGAKRGAGSVDPGKGWYLLAEGEPLKPGDGFLHPYHDGFIDYNCRPDWFRAERGGSETVHRCPWRRKLD